MSRGEDIIRTSFNPTNDELVSKLKQKSAELIDLVHDNKSLDERLAALAITSYECAAMWAVKMATAKK